MVDRIVLLVSRDRTHRAASARFRWQWIIAGNRADGFLAIKPPAKLASARGAAVRMPSRSLRTRLVQMIRARSSTAAYEAAAFVCLVSVAASLSAPEQRWATNGGRLALAEGAVVLIHGETLFAVEAADELGADPFVVQRAFVCRGIMWQRLTGAHWATILVLNEVAVQSAVRQIRTNFVIFRHIVGALADRTIILIRAEAVETFHLAVVQGPASVAGTLIEGAVVCRWWTVRTALARIRRYRVFAGFAHGHLAGRDPVLVADASAAVILLPFFAKFPRDAFVNTVLRLLLGFRPRNRV